MQDYIARRDHSEQELRTKLKKYHTQEEIEGAIRDAQTAGWMAEPETMAERATAALGRRGKGHHYIQAFLRRKGLPGTSRDLEQESEKARALLEIKLKPGEGRDKALRLLRNRGYDLEVISRVIRTLGKGEK